MNGKGTRELAFDMGVSWMIWLLCTVVAWSNEGDWGIVFALISVAVFMVAMRDTRKLLRHIDHKKSEAK